MSPALVASLERLPAPERAVLVLRDVLRWEAGDVAELLDMRLDSVNCALQRARAAIGEPGAEPLA